MYPGNCYQHFLTQLISPVKCEIVQLSKQAQKKPQNLSHLLRYYVKHEIFNSLNASNSLRGEWSVPKYHHLAPSNVQKCQCTTTFNLLRAQLTLSLFQFDKNFEPIPLIMLSNSSLDGEPLAVADCSF